MEVLWKHTKTKHLYKIIAHAVMESSLIPTVVYQKFDGSGPIWVRPAADFFDGRFRQDIDFGLDEEDEQGKKPGGRAKAKPRPEEEENAGATD